MVEDNALVLLLLLLRSLLLLLLLLLLPPRPLGKSQATAKENLKLRSDMHLAESPATAARVKLMPN